MSLERRKMAPTRTAEMYGRRSRRSGRRREVNHEAPVVVAEQSERGPVEARHCTTGGPAGAEADQKRTVLNLCRALVFL